MNTYSSNRPVSQTAPTERADFIRRTYSHLAGAILLFIALTAYMVHSPLANTMLNIMQSGYGWLLILGAFMILGRFATDLAQRNTNQNVQYAGLTLYVLFESIIFTPILYLAAYHSSPDVLPTAGIMTLGIFGGLTYIAFTSKKDFSFLRSALAIFGAVALALIVSAVVFGFSLGLLFSFAMVLLASGAILYDTSRILHHYESDQHVAASLQLFASIALLFWYILRIFMSRR